MSVRQKFEGAFISGEKLKAWAREAGYRGAEAMMNSAEKAKKYLKGPEFEAKIDELIRRTDNTSAFSSADSSQWNPSDRIRRKITFLLTEYAKQVATVGAFAGEIGSIFGKQATVYSATVAGGVQLIFIIGEICFVFFIRPNGVVIPIRSPKNRPSV